MNGGDIVAIVCALEGAVAAIIVAIIETSSRRRHKREEQRAKRRELESRLSMELQCATLELSYVTSLAVTGGHTNGNVEAAQKRAMEAKRAYEDFIRDEAAHAVAKI